MEGQESGESFFRAVEGELQKVGSKHNHLSRTIISLLILVFVVLRVFRLEVVINELVYGNLQLSQLRPTRC